MLADQVWEETLKRAIPQENHKSTDGILVIEAIATFRRQSARKAAANT